MYSPWRHIPSVLWKRRPIQLTFFLTRKCNASCPWCFYLRSTDQPDPGPDTAEELSLAEIGRVSASLGPLLWVVFSGGEVFLRDRLVDIAGVFHDRNRPPIMVFPTNGLLPGSIREQTEQIVARCPDSVIVVKVSIDGIGEAHDALRGSAGGFEKAMETYRLLGDLAHRHANLEIGINTLFCSENQDRMDEIIDFVAALETEGTHTISVIRGNLREDRYQRIDAAKYRRAIDRLALNLARGAARLHGFAGARVKAAQDIVQRRLIHRTLLAGRRLVPCYAGRLALVLTETGEVYPCEILKHGMGNVRDHDHDMARLLRSEAGARVTREVAEGGCHCTHECNFITNILFNPRLYPRLLGQYLKIAG